MFVLALKAAIAFAIAALISWSELVTSKYPRTIKLFWRKSWALWAYPAIYGLISLGFTLAYIPLTQAGLLRFEQASVTDTGKSDKSVATDAKKAEGAEKEKAAGDEPNKPGDGPTWLAAIMLGLSAKALLHIRFFSVPTSGTQQTFPVGTETVVQIFEPWLMRTIAIDEFNAVSSYLQTKAIKYPDLDSVKARIRENLPGPASFPEPERTALELDVDRSSNVRSALEIYLRAFGVSTVDQRFPDSPAVAPSIAT